MGENLYEAAFAVFPDAITIQDTNFKVLYQNAAHKRIYGNQTGNLCYAAYHNRAAKCDGCVLSTVFENGKIHSWQTITKTGGVLAFLEITTSPILDETGKTTAILDVARDVTDYKKTEEDLRAVMQQIEAERAKSEAILQSIGDAITIQDTDFRIIYQNKAAIDMGGGHTGEHCYEAYELNSGVCESCQFELAIEDGRIHHMQREVPDGNGVKYLEITASPLKNSAGRVIAGIEVVRDLTERRKLGKAYQKMAETLKSLVDFSPLAIIALTLDGVITSWNRAAETIFGWRETEVKGLMNPLIPEDKREEFKSHLEKVGSGQVITGVRVKRKKKDGGLLDLNLAVSPVKDENGITGMLAFLEDITGQVMMEEQMLAERNHSEEKIKRQLERIRALRKIDTAIAGSLDLKILLDLFLDEVLSKLNADAADILLLNPHMMLLEHAASKGFNTEGIKHIKLKVGDSCAGQAVLQRKSFVFPDIFEAQCDYLTDREHHFPQTHLVLNEGFKAYFGVPLMVKGQVKGVLEVFHRSILNPDEEWLEFLDSLAKLGAVAINDSMIFEALQKSNDELVMAYDTTIEGWSKALDYRDRETEGHSHRVTEMVIKVAEAFGFKNGELAHIRRGALLHDIGKLGVPDGILLKAGPLTAEEWIIMKKHPDIAFDLLSPIAYLEPAIVIPYYHHEKWDGTGYPVGLKGKQIPLAARIFAVVDVWDALSSDRPYRKAWPQETVIEHLRRLSGQHFDPEVVDVFLKILKTKS